MHVQGGAPSQQTRHARRLYVGGLSEVPEREIEEFFADLVKKSIINKANIRGNPILSVYLNPERKFAFVEFNSIELANAFLDVGCQLCTLAVRSMCAGTVLSCCRYFAAGWAHLP
jgi:RNA recognition motif-containing protein